MRTYEPPTTAASEISAPTPCPTDGCQLLLFVDAPPLPTAFYRHAELYRRPPWIRGLDDASPVYLEDFAAAADDLPPAELFDVLVFTGDLPRVPNRCDRLMHVPPFLGAVLRSIALGLARPIVLKDGRIIIMRAGMNPEPLTPASEDR